MEKRKEKLYLQQSPQLYLNKELKLHNRFSKTCSHNWKKQSIEKPKKN
jgi:hypothetical protein